MSAERTWFVDGGTGRTLSRAELLRDLASAQSCRPLCQPSDTADALAAIAGALVTGSRLVLLDRDFSASEIAALGYATADVNQSRAVSTSTELTWEKIQQAATGASHACVGLFTSGSTGLPKLVWQSAGNLARGVRVSPRHAEAIWGLAYNPTHVAGIQVFLQALANGCPVVDIYGLGRKEALDAIERHGITHLSATPSYFRLLLPADRPQTQLRSVTLGGESSDAALLQRLRHLFPAARFHNIYASTEAGTLLVAEGDVFEIASGLEQKIVIKDGRIHVHRSLLGEFRSGGQDPAEGAMSEWYDTGDVVEIASSAPLRFRIVARERDWVNVGGSKVNPREVESVLEEVPGVRKVRVVGRKNSVMGSILCAEVERSDPAVNEAQLRDFAGARLQPFKVPRLIRFVESIAQTRTGKLSRQ